MTEHMSILSVGFKKFPTNRFVGNFYHFSLVFGPFEFAT
jgi:hypothetical protein